MLFKKMIFSGVIMLSLLQNGWAQQSLDFYINKAKENSPLVYENNNLSKANQLEVERLKAFYTKPQVGLNANYMTFPVLSRDNDRTKLVLNPENPIHYSGYDLAYSNGGQYQAMFNITQPVFTGELFSDASAPAKVASLINQNTAKLSAHDLEKVVGDQFILCTQDSKQIQFAKATLKLITEQHHILEKLVESSLYKKSDITLLNIEKTNFYAQLVAFQANYKRDLMDLNISCGISDTSIVDIENSELEINEHLKTSQFLDKYRLDSLNLVAQQRAFETKYKPQVNLFANTGLNAVYGPTIPQRFGLGAGISLTYNLWDGGQRSVNQEKTQILEESVSKYKSNFITQNNLRKTKILSELKSYDARIAYFEQQLSEYKTLLKSYQQEMNSGQLSVVNYITVLKNMAQVQRDYTLLFTQQQLLINAYNYWNW